MHLSGSALHARPNSSRSRQVPAKPQGTRFSYGAPHVVLCHSRQLLVRPSAASAPVTDNTVPEGHAGLHDSLYGENGDAHAVNLYRLRKEEDDGSVLVPLDDWLSNRDGERPLGVYAIYDADKALQYIGYSRNTVTAVRGHATRVGPARAAYVRAMVFANKAMATREQLERQVASWVDTHAGGVLPPGNAAEQSDWEDSGSIKVLSETEAAAYADKAAKLKRAMGEGRKDGEDSHPRDPEQTRADWKKAVEGDNWSEVIDRQTQDAVTSSTPAAAPSAATPTTAASPMVSPFSQPTVHRSIGEGEGAKQEMTVETVDRVLDEVRPYLMSDGGDVEVAGVEHGVVFLRLQGQCSTCAASSATMKMGIERALKAAFGDDLKEVVQVDKVDVIRASAESVDLHLNMLRGAVHGLGGKVEVAGVQDGVVTLKYKGPPAIGKGVQAAVRDQFPDIHTVNLVDF